MEKTLTFRPLPRLTGAARRALATTFQGHDYRAEIEQGGAQLWQVLPGRLFLITRLEKNTLVVCCAAGQGIAEAGVYLLAAAMQHKLTEIRFHTQRPALAKLLNKAG